MNEEMMEMEMVDDDQIENVGIMSGFMDDIEELMAEISEEEMNGMEEGDEADMARMMNRTPDSPEILMNNLRGDMRSIDARREELADLVGMREAEETPEGVLALLQPVLAQQDAVAAMPMPMPAPPMPAPPMPPMPAQPSGIETISVDETVVPAMYKGGSVQNFNRGSGQMGVTPAQRFTPSDVRYYETGTPEEGVVSGGRFSPAAVTSADEYISTLLKAQPSATALNLPTLMGQEAKLYESLGLGTPKEDVQSQILFDIAQAALQYGSNVGPDGKPMGGSQAAKLGQIGAPLAGRVGARAAEMSKEDRALKMLALQSAQGKIATAQAADIALAKQQGDLAVEIAKQDPPARLLTTADFELPQYAGLDSTLPWQIDGAGKLSIAGGREPAPLVDMGENTLERVGVTALVEPLVASYTNARNANKNIRKIDETLVLLEKGDVDTGFGAEFRNNVRKAISLFSDNPEMINTLTDTELLNSALGKEVFGAISALGIGARGLDTPAEREFLREVVAGKITLNKETLVRMAQIRRRAEENAIKDWNETLASGRADSLIEISQGILTNDPLTIPPSVLDEADAL
tara:strand:- start:207 stop:1940 length:1734 start_codon:yes stop_codon:yes gene_type:complete